MIQKLKTISGHYGTIYCQAHNNRDFLSPNVDPSRTPNNDYLVAVGRIADEEVLDLMDMRDLWTDYHALSTLYWSEYACTRDELYERTRAIYKAHYSLEWSLWYISPSPVLALIQLLLLPLTIATQVTLDVLMEKQLEGIELEKFALLIEKEMFKAHLSPFRKALTSNDRRVGTQIRNRFDELVRQAEDRSSTLWQPPRFASIEEIYNKVFEPGFQQFQKKQRPCRRFNGTYLEQIRADQAKEAKKKGISKKSRCHAEAIEITFCIGDRDNTGYKAAPDDAAQAEELLRMLSRHLLSSPHVCVITTNELNDPNWSPPFKYGLILLNLVGHFDEDTPGIHATFIPYASGYTRGPALQPSLGKAFTGMGYPSKWEPTLDEHGQPIPKVDRDGKPVLNEDGTLRYKQEPTGKGVIDWIEEQKSWLQQEMKQRYGWEREHKGSHPRGNLSISDYKVARAQERLQEVNDHIHEQADVLADLNARVEQQEFALDDAILGAQDVVQWMDRILDNVCEDDTELDIIRRFLAICSNDEYERILDHASKTIATERNRKQEEIHASLSTLLGSAKERAALQQQTGRSTPRQLSSAVHDDL